MTRLHLPQWLKGLVPFDALKIPAEVKDRALDHQNTFRYTETIRIIRLFAFGACWGHLLAVAAAILMTFGGVNGVFVGMPTLPALVSLAYVWAKGLNSPLEPWAASIRVIALRHLSIEVYFYGAGILIYFLQSHIAIRASYLDFVSSLTMAGYLLLHLGIASLGQKRIKNDLSKLEMTS